MAALAQARADVAVIAHQLFWTTEVIRRPSLVQTERPLLAGAFGDGREVAHRVWHTTSAAVVVCWRSAGVFPVTRARSFQVLAFFGDLRGLVVVGVLLWVMLDPRAHPFWKCSIVIVEWLFPEFAVFVDRPDRPGSLQFSFICSVTIGIVSPIEDGSTSVVDVSAEHPVLFTIIALAVIMVWTDCPV